MDLETLERRRLMSVSVVQGYPGYYEVYGTDAADAISISVQNAQSSADASFTLDGVTYGGVAYVSVFAAQGDDLVSVAIHGEGSVASSVVGDDGNDDLTLSGAGAIWGDSGDDVLHLSNSFRGEVYGGPGQDRIYVAGACVDAQVEGEQGSDLIDASANSYGIFANGGQGDDTVFGSNFDDQIYGGPGHDLLIGHGGNDVFYTADMQHDRIIGGAGIDVAYVDLGEAGVWGVEYVFYV